MAVSIRDKKNIGTGEKIHLLNKSKQPFPNLDVRNTVAGYNDTWSKKSVLKRTTFNRK